MSCLYSRRLCWEASVSFAFAQAYLPLSSPRVVSCSGFFVSCSSMNTSNSAFSRAAPPPAAASAASEAERREEATSAASSEPVAAKNWRRLVTRTIPSWPGERSRGVRPQHACADADLKGCSRRGRPQPGDRTASRGGGALFLGGVGG